MRHQKQRQIAIRFIRSISSSAIWRWLEERWRDGHMVLRWVGAALHEASTHFRRVRGYREMPILIAALAKLDKQTKKAA